MGATMWVGVKLFMFNADLGIMTMMIVNFFFAPSGEIIGFLEAASFYVEPYRDMVLAVFFDVLWLLFLIEILVRFASHFARVVRAVLRAVLEHRLHQHRQLF